MISPNRHPYLEMFLCCALIVLPLVSCTESPFGSSKIRTGNDAFSGLVTAPDGTPAANAHIWLSGLNVSSRAEMNGEFELRLPNVGSFGARENINGAFDAYFYVANFQVGIRQVAVRNGEFLYGQGDINDDGGLKTVVELDSLLNIKTVVLPAQIGTSDRQRITADVALVTPQRGAANVQFPVSPAFPTGAVILRNIDTGVFRAFPIVSGDPIRGSVTIGHVARHFPMEFIVEAGELPSGTYEVIPHIIIINDTLPPGLLASLSAFFGFPDAEYMKLPFIREEGYLVINSE